VIRILPDVLNAPPPYGKALVLKAELEAPVMLVVLMAAVLPVLVLLLLLPVDDEFVVDPLLLML
jgi:hypothetical protein